MAISSQIQVRKRWGRKEPAGKAGLWGGAPGFGTDLRVSRRSGRGRARLAETSAVLVGGLHGVHQPFRAAAHLADGVGRLDQIAVPLAYHLPQLLFLVLNLGPDLALQPSDLFCSVCLKKRRGVAQIQPLQRGGGGGGRHGGPSATLHVTSVLRPRGGDAIFVRGGSSSAPLLARLAFCGRRTADPWRGILKKGDLVVKLDR